MSTVSWAPPMDSGSGCLECNWCGSIKKRKSFLDIIMILITFNWYHQRPALLTSFESCPGRPWRMGSSFDVWSDDEISGPVISREHVVNLVKTMLLKIMKRKWRKEQERRSFGLCPEGLEFCFVSRGNYKTEFSEGLTNDTQTAWSAPIKQYFRNILR